MIRIAEVTYGLARSAQGYWSAAGSTLVSYPSHGSDQCFGIEDGSVWFQQRNRAIQGVVGSFPPRRNGGFLDVGGGNGYVTRALQDGRFPAALLEPSHAGARNAVARGVEQVICGGNETVTLREHSAAAIVPFDVVGHVSNDPAFPRSLLRLLRRGGRIYISVPPGPARWSIDHAEAGHFRRSRRSDIEALLTRCGFILDYSTSLFWFLPLPILTLRSLPTKMGLRKRVTTENIRAEHQVKPGWTRWLMAKVLGLEMLLLEHRVTVPDRIESSGGRHAARRHTVIRTAKSQSPVLNRLWCRMAASRKRRAPC